MKKAIFLLAVVFICSNLKAQNRFTGYLYTLQSGAKERFEYSVTTSFSDGVYKTVYRLFKPGSQKNRYSITASNFKDSKKVVVVVNDKQYLLSVMNGKEETTYDTFSLKPFGFRGNLSIFDKSAPSQLAVQFISNRFEYVKVLSFLGSYSDNIDQFFIFSQNDKIIEAKAPVAAAKNANDTLSGPNQMSKSTSGTRWFTGTKKFCDGVGEWYYKVTITGNKITLQSYADKNNESQKDHTDPVETIHGIIKGKEIITNDPPQYKTNRFKFENGILYEVNDEGEYNEYNECEK
jgi:hypothetical protein